VLDPQGNPVAGATILFMRTTRSQHAAVMNNEARVADSDADGNFRVRAQPGSSLRARYGELATQSPVPVPTLGEPVTLQLSGNATFTLHLKIVDGNGNLISNPSVTANAGMNQDSTVPPGRYLSDRSLELYDFTCDMPWRLRVGAPDYGTLQVAVPPPLADSPGRVEMTVTLPKADQPVGGIVVDQDEKPAPGVVVAITGPQITSTLVTTDAQGRFLFHIAKGTQAIVRLVLSPPYTAYAQVTGRRTDLKFYLPAEMTPGAGGR
jgi:hypothetical protein